MSWLLQLDPGVRVRLGICAALPVAFSATMPGFASVANGASITETIRLVALAATGIVMTMVIGQLDLAVASVAAIAAFMALSLAGTSLVQGVAAALPTGGVPLEGGRGTKRMIEQQHGKQHAASEASGRCGPAHEFSVGPR